MTRRTAACCPYRSFINMNGAKAVSSNPGSIPKNSEVSNFFLPPNGSVTLRVSQLLRALVYSAINEAGLVIKCFKFPSMRDAQKHGNKRWL